ncbi:MAG: 30S ribosomal protein S5 alanine N-acetyltransferase [Rhizobiales bacterium]|nr:30S ribosomal protein S5 alanine N-acetyltransferase [Hyphomicrobiales bacterium]MBA70523.1 30S ribosomal protein S5 alanine N-acetyltransferase [Hyphomicrobiales bacterium]
MYRPTFRFRQRVREVTVLEGPKVYLAHPRYEDYEQWRALRKASRAFLEPWEPRWPADDLTREAFRHRIRRYHADRSGGFADPYFIFLGKDNTLVGGITIGSIRRGAAESCMLGYWMGEAYAGQGLMQAALQVLIPHIFDGLRLHRIEAACIPENQRSSHLLEKAGFRREGYLHSYLRINGAWRDHLLYALIAEEWRAKQAASKAMR